MSAWTMHERGRIQIHDNGSTWIFGDDGTFVIARQGVRGWYAEDGEFVVHECHATEADLIRSLIGDPQ